MEKYLHPEYLDCNPNSPSSPDEWRHWYRTIKSFFRTLGDREFNKLDALVNFLSPAVYKYIADFTTYWSAIRHLEGLYIKPKNEVFARHILSTMKQQAGQSIDKYLQELRHLSQDCCFKAVSAKQYRGHFIQDSFISGLASPAIRQRLLENKTGPWHRCSQSSVSYLGSTKHWVVCETFTDDFVVCNATTVDQEDSVLTAATSGRTEDTRKCWNCRGAYSCTQRWKCPARGATCSKCGRKGHYAKFCPGGAPPKNSCGFNAKCQPHSWHSLYSSIRLFIRLYNRDNSGPQAPYSTSPRRQSKLR